VIGLASGIGAAGIGAAGIGAAGNARSGLGVSGLGGFFLFDRSLNLREQPGH